VRDVIGCPDLQFGFVRRGSFEVSNAGFLREYVNLEYTYRLDSTSSATAKFQASGCLLEDVASGQYDLAVMRDDRIAWVGPLVSIDEDEAGLVTAVGQDVSWWLSVRRLIRSYNSMETPVLATDLAVKLLADAFERDNSANAKWVVEAPGPRVRRDIRAKTFASQPFQELGQSAIDWSARGRTIYLWGESAPRDPVGRITNDLIIGKPSLRDSVDNRASAWIGVGASSALQDGGYSELEVTAKDTALAQRIGLIERELRDPEVTERATLQTLVNSALTRSQTGAPVSATVALRPDAGIDFADVSPGKVFTVDLVGDALRTRGALRVVGWTESDGPEGRTLRLDLGSEAA
jgi:hypothetical protein